MFEPPADAATRPSVLQDERSGLRIRVPSPFTGCQAHYKPFINNIAPGIAIFFKHDLKFNYQGIERRATFYAFSMNRNLVENFSNFTPIFPLLAFIHPYTYNDPFYNFKMTANVQE